MHILTLTAFHSLPPSLPPTCVQWYQTSCKTLGHCPQAVCGKEPGLAGGCFDLAWAVDMLKRFETVGACSKDGAQTGKDSWATCDPTTCKTFPLEKITVGGGLYYKSVWGQPDGQLTAQNVFDMDTAVGNRLQGAGAWSINYGLVGGVNEPGSLPSDPSFFPDLGTKWGITGRRRLTMQASKMQSHGAGFGAAVMAKVSAVVDAVVTTFASPASSSFSAPSSSSTSRLLAECDAKPDTTTTCAATAACPTDPSAAGGGTGTGTGGAAADGATTYAWCVGPPTSATACPAYSPATCPTACGKGSSTRTRTVQCMETTRPKGVAATPTTAPDAKCTASSKPPVSSACAATAACSGGGGSTGGSTGGTARCGKDYGDANGRCGTSCPSKTNAECTVAGETCFASLKACDTSGADKAKADKDKAASDKVAADKAAADKAATDKAATDKAAADKAATDKAAADKAGVDKAAADKAYADAKAKADASGSAEDAKAAADAKATASAAAAAAKTATEVAAASAKAASAAEGGGGGGDGVPSWALAVVLVLCVAVLMTVVVGAWFYVKRHNKAGGGGNEFSKSFGGGNGGGKSLEMGNA